MSNCFYLHCNLQQDVLVSQETYDVILTAMRYGEPLCTQLNRTRLTSGAQQGDDIGVLKNVIRDFSSSASLLSRINIHE